MGRRPSIAVRLGLAAGALVAAAVAATLFLIYDTTVGSARDEFDYRVHREMEELVTHHVSGGSDALAIEVKRRVRDAEGERFYYMLVASSSQPIAGNLDGWPEKLELAGGVTSFNLSSHIGGLLRELHGKAMPFEDGHRLLVGEDVTERVGFERDLRTALVGAGVLAVFLALAAGITIGQNLLSRVKRMNRTIVRILGGNSSERVESSGRDDEFEELVRHFNALLDEKDRLIERVREVTHDISHDLRTPLSRMRNRLELALAAPREAGHDAEVITRTLEDAGGILDTFDALLAIAQMESGVLQARMEPVALDELARDAVELYGPVAEEAGSSVELSVEPVEVQGERHLLAHATTNLLDNAVKYAATAAPIEVRVVRGPEGPELVVADRGPGIPAEERERVTQRFVRLDASRGQPGTGLGLAFVEAVARLHGARLELYDNAPGLAARLVFRTTDPPHAGVGL